MPTSGWPIDALILLACFGCVGLILDFYGILHRFRTFVRIWRESGSLGVAWEQSSAEWRPTETDDTDWDWTLDPRLHCFRSPLQRTNRAKVWSRAARERVRKA